MHGTCKPRADALRSHTMGKASTHTTFCRYLAPGAPDHRLQQSTLLSTAECANHA